MFPVCRPTFQFNSRRPSNPDMIATRLGRLHVFPFVAESYQRLFGLPTSLGGS